MRRSSRSDDHGDGGSRSRGDAGPAQERAGRSPSNAGSARGREGRSPGDAGASGEFDRRATVRFVVETALYALVARLAARYGRDPTLWVFGARGGEAFEDNGKYLYLHVAEERPSVRAVWLSRDGQVVERLRAAGHEAHHAYSLRGAYYNLRAGVVCLTHDPRDVNLACTGGAEVAQLWHGVPLKRIGWDAEVADRSLAVRLCLGYLRRNVSLLVLTARELSGPFASGLRVDRDSMAVGAYPRTDALAGEVPGEGVGVDDAVRDRLDRAAEEGPLLFYLPTYRGGEGAGFRGHIDLDALEAFLAERDAHLAVKPHPKEPVDLGEGTGSRVIEVPPGTDVYPLLRRADALVTDYSSVAFDYLLLDRPLAYYPYDLDRYREERGFYFDYGAVTPGPTARDFDGLLDALARILDGDEFSTERAAVRDRFFESTGGDASAVAFRLVDERLGRNSP